MVAMLVGNDWLLLPCTGETDKHSNHATGTLRYVIYCYHTVHHIPVHVQTHCLTEIYQPRPGAGSLNVMH